MKLGFKIFIGAMLFIALLFGLQYAGIVNYSYFAPKKENARREVFESTQSYVESKRQLITKYYDEWRKSDKEEKNAIRSIVLQEFANFDLTKLSPTQKDWYDKIVESPNF